MSKKLDDATRLLVDSLPENLQKLAVSSMEHGYLSQMDFNAACGSDEIPEEEHQEVLDLFKQDLGLDVLETGNYQKDIERYYDEDSAEIAEKYRNLLNNDAEQVDNDEDYEHYAKQLERSQTGTLVLGVQDSVQSYLNKSARCNY